MKSILFKSLILLFSVTIILSCSDDTKLDEEKLTDPEDIFRYDDRFNLIYSQIDTITEDTPFNTIIFISQYTIPLKLRTRELLNMSFIRVLLDGKNTEFSFMYQILDNEEFGYTVYPNVDRKRIGSVVETRCYKFNNLTND